MADKFVSEDEFNRYLIRSRFGNNSAFEMINYCDFLEDKKIRMESQKEKCAEHEFLYQSTKMANFSSYYAEEVEKYIKSKGFSNKVKKWMLEVLESVEGFLLLKGKIASDVDFNDFYVEDLQEIDIALSRAKDSEKDELLTVFERYMFTLDGEGPCKYIRMKYSDKKDLALEILAKSNIDTSKKTICNGLLVEYIMAIYRMYHRYLPMQEANFLKFIEFEGFNTLDEFVLNYESFVNRGFIVEEDRCYSCGREDKMSIAEGQAVKALFKEAVVSLSGDEPLERIIKRVVYTPKRP